MRGTALSGSSVGHGDCACGLGPEGAGETGREEAGEEALSSGLAAADQPLLPELQKLAAAAGGRRGEDGRCRLTSH